MSGYRGRWTDAVLDYQGSTVLLFQNHHRTFVSSMARAHGLQKIGRLLIFATQAKKKCYLGAAKILPLAERDFW